MAVCDNAFQHRLRRAALSLLLILLANILIAQPAVATNPFVSYANDFVNPDTAAAGQYASDLRGAQETVIAWAEEMNQYGPWSVTAKPVTPPSGDKHDYMSWAPYHWPDCSKVGNKTALTPAQIRTTCPYVVRDGQVNPDRSIPDDFQEFFNLSDAVLYNALAHTFQSESSSKYSQNIAKYIKTWFIDPSTSMNPNLNYAQMDLGPTGQNGTFTGLLDLRMIAKIASGVLIIRKRGSSDWTPQIDNQFVAWCKQYITWIQTAPTAKQAAAAKNNHGTYYVNQLMALMLIVGDTAGATEAGRGYFGSLYKSQIASNGEQPLEASRTRPYHYRNFNIAGMITNARMLKYADPTSNVWNTTSNGGATIQTAVDFVMTMNPATTQETNVTEEIYPNVEAVAATYGDPQRKYVNFLQASGFPYADDPSFLWDQPIEPASRSAAGSSSAAKPSPSRSAVDSPAQGSGAAGSPSSIAAAGRPSSIGTAGSPSLIGAASSPSPIAVADSTSSIGPLTSANSATTTRAVQSLSALYGVLLVLMWGVW